MSANFQSLAEAAYQKDLVETSICAISSASAALLPFVDEPERNPFLDWRPGENHIWSYALVDTVMDGAFCYLRKGQTLIAETGRNLEVYFSVKPDSVCIPIDGRIYVAAGNAAQANYFHWVTQCLPSVYLALQRYPLEDVVFILKQPVLSFHIETLLRLGVDPARTILLKDSQQYRFPNLIYSDFLCGSASFAISRQVGNAYRRLAARVGSGAGPRKLYVSRADSQSRRLRNEGALIEKLQEMGYTCVTLSGLRFEQQVKLFKNAEIVVGPHGAGLSNIAFASRGTIVYELIPASYPNPCFANLALVAGCYYWMDAFGGSGSPQPSVDAWDVDIDRVIARLTQLDLAAQGLLQQGAGLRHE